MGTLGEGLNSDERSTEEHVITPRGNNNTMMSRRTLLRVLGLGTAGLIVAGGVARIWKKSGEPSVDFSGFSPEELDFIEQAQFSKLLMEYEGLSKLPDENRQEKGASFIDNMDKFIVYLKKAGITQLSEEMRLFQRYLNAYPISPKVDVNGWLGSDAFIAAKQVKHTDFRTYTPPEYSLESSDEAFRDRYMSDEVDINPWIPLDKEKRLRGNSRDYITRAKETIMEFFTPQELLELHQSLQNLLPSERVLKVAMAFDAKHKGSQKMKFKDCNNFATAVYVFAGMGDEKNTKNIRNVVGHESDGWKSFGKVEFGTRKIGNEWVFTNVDTDHLPQRGDRVYVFGEHMEVEEHSGIALAPMEVHEVGDKVEVWLWIISQPSTSKGPIIEPRRIIGSRNMATGLLGDYGFTEGYRFKSGYYDKQKWLDDDKFIRGRYGEDGQNVQRSNGNKNGHVLKKIDRPRDNVPIQN